MNTYKGNGVTLQVKTSDNAFKIILPNLNAWDEQKSLFSQLDENEQKVIELAKQLVGKSLIVRKGKNTKYYLPK